MLTFFIDIFCSVLVLRMILSNKKRESHLIPFLVAEAGLEPTTFGL